MNASNIVACVTSLRRFVLFLTILYVNCRVTSHMSTAKDDTLYLDIGGSAYWCSILLFCCTI